MGPGEQFIHGGILADSQRNRKMFDSTLTHPCLPKQYQLFAGTGQVEDKVSNLGFQKELKFFLLRV